MTERHRRERVRDERPPSLHMRRLLRQAWFAVARLQRQFQHRQRIGPTEADEVMRVLELTRHTLARDGIRPWLAGLESTRAPDLREAMDALTLAREQLGALDLDWQRRLVAAGLDPRWPGSDD
jgi:hypothetical protein